MKNSICIVHISFSLCNGFLFLNKDNNSFEYLLIIILVTMFVLIDHSQERINKDRFDSMLISELKQEISNYQQCSRNSLLFPRKRKLNLLHSDLSGVIRKKVVEISIIKEVIELIHKRKFNEIRRFEIRKRTPAKTWLIIHGILFSNIDELICCVVHAARYRLTENFEDIAFERANFSNYLTDVKPYVEVIGNLYRKKRRL